MPVRIIEWKNKDEKIEKRWLADFIFRGKRIRRSGFSTKRQAQIWIDKERLLLEEDYFNNRKKSNSTLTVKEFLGEWLDAIQSGNTGRSPVERGTYTDYESSCRLHILPYMGEKIISELTALNVVALRSTLIGKVSRLKAQRTLKHLRVALNYGVQAGHVTFNAADKIRIEDDKRTDRRVKLISREEMRAILHELERRANLEPHRWVRFATLFIVLQGTGMRISEARALKWSAVDLDAALVHIHQRADGWGKLGNVKSRAAYRTITLDSFQIAWLRRWRTVMPIPSCELVFPNTQGKVDSRENLYHRFWKPLCVALGMTTAEGTPNFAFHATRHFRVSELIASGADVREIMGEIGHANGNLIFSTYGHLFPDDLKKRHARAQEIADRLTCDKSVNL